MLRKSFPITVFPSLLPLAPDVLGCATTAPISLEHTTTTLLTAFALTKLAGVLVARRQELFILAAPHNIFETVVYPLFQNRIKQYKVYKIQI